LESEGRHVTGDVQLSQGVGVTDTDIALFIDGKTILNQVDSGINQLSELPVEIGQLINLQTLDLRRNRLKEWPSQIEQLSAITIDLRGNEILPPVIEAELRIEREKEIRAERIVKNIQTAIHHFAESGVRLDDEVSFLRSWIERPLSVGGVTPSGKPLARTMARYVDPNSTGPVVELGPGTGPVTEALVEAGVEPSRLVLVEFNPAFCRILRSRFPAATLVQGDAYSMRRLLDTLLTRPAAAIVSGLPLVTKPISMRLRLLRDAYDLMLPGAPFVQFTYSIASPLPRLLDGFSVEASERIWMNLPPARVWVYRKNRDTNDIQGTLQTHGEAEPIPQRRKSLPKFKLAPLGNVGEQSQSESSTTSTKPDSEGQRNFDLKEFEIHVHNLYQTLQQEPVLDGFNHPGLSILIRAFESYPNVAAQWMHDQITNLSRPSIAADILRLLCRFKPHTSAWRRDVVVAALQSKSDELRDAAIQAVETWAEPELVALLKAHSDTAPWLADYATQVIRDLAY